MIHPHPGVPNVGGKTTGGKKKVTSAKTIRVAKPVKGYHCDALASNTMIFIEPQLNKDLIQLYHQAAKVRPSSEWAVVIFGRKDKTTYVLESFFLPEQEASSGSFEFDYSLIPEPPEGQEVLGIMHQHPGSMSTSSSTDDLHNLGSHPIGGIIYKQGNDVKFTFYLKVELPCAPGQYKLYKLNEEQVGFMLPPLEDNDFEEMIKANVKAKTYGGYQSAVPVNRALQSNARVWDGRGWRQADMDDMIDAAIVAEEMSPDEETYMEQFLEFLAQDPEQSIQSQSELPVMEPEDTVVDALGA